jgi:hypothetical protein
MPRKVKTRTSYFKDAVTLRRIAEAVEQDPDAHEQWKKDAAGHLYAAMRMFMEKGTPDANATNPNGIFA